jgi:hypothetical protein
MKDFRRQPKIVKNSSDRFSSNVHPKFQSNSSLLLVTVEPFTRLDSKFALSNLLVEQLDSLEKRLVGEFLLPS